MYTKDNFLEIAALHESLARDHERGIMRTSYLRSARDAENAALIMEELGLETVEQLGPFGAKALGRGTKVLIKKGTEIATTNPRYDRTNPKIAGRDYVVTLHGKYDGYIDGHWHKGMAYKAYSNQQVMWAGTGGYWCYVDSSLVEIIKGE